MSYATLSIVIPVFNEAANLEALHQRLGRTCDQLATLGVGTSILYVDDGSTDRSLDLLRAQSTRDPRVRVVSLSRNFGHQAAIMAGLSASTADAVVIMDADLQDPPEVIPDLVAQWRSGARVVRAMRAVGRSEAPAAWASGPSIACTDGSETSRKAETSACSVFSTAGPWMNSSACRKKIDSCLACGHGSASISEPWSTTVRLGRQANPSKA
jgi:glycosyltransferase involved in cell wall biosynthesis